jgi:hypothetical protein
MLDRLWLSVAFAATTSLCQLACDVSEAAPSLPAPAKRDAGPADAAVIDAVVLDASLDAAAGPLDAGIDGLPPLIDGGVRRRRPRPPRDAGVIVDAAPPIDAAPPPVDAAVMDAALPTDARIIDQPVIDARDILHDSGEAPPLYDASILGDL